MSDSVQPLRRQPTRLPCPWDSLGKNTGVGCHFLVQCMKVKVKSLSHVRLLATPWTAAHQAPPSMGFSRQEYWSGVPLPSPGHQPYFSVKLTLSLKNNNNKNKALGICRKIIRVLTVASLEFWNERRKRLGQKKMFKEIMVQNFTNWGKK